MIDRETPSRWQQLWDLLLALALSGIAVAVHLSGSEAVAANRDPSVFSVLATVLAVGPLAVRRRYPVPVLVLTLAGLLLLVATHNTVGSATIGCIVAFYTAVAYGTREEVRAAVVLMTVGSGAGLAMRPVDLSTEGALVHLVVITAAGTLAMGVRQRRERYRAEVVSAKERAARSATEERLRLTRELHDIIGHAMSVMVVQAGVAERFIGTNPERARTAVAEIAATGRRSMSEMRQVLDTLRDGDVDSSDGLPRDPLPTLAQVPDLVARVEASGLRVSIDSELDPAATSTLPGGLQLAAYRVVQEALTNCLAHAAASTAWVELTRHDAVLRVVVTDDGRGAPPSSAGRSGQGLAGMRERVTLYGGELAAGPRPGGGFQVTATFPVPTATQPTESLA